jgi:hypothetical protein
MDLPLDDHMEAVVTNRDKNTVWAEVEAIVMQFGGNCCQCGPIGPEHKPFADLFKDIEELDKKEKEKKEIESACRKWREQMRSKSQYHGANAINNPAKNGGEIIRICRGDVTTRLLARVAFTGCKLDLDVEQTTAELRQAGYEVHPMPSRSHRSPGAGGLPRPKNTAFARDSGWDDAFDDPRIRPGKCGELRHQ